MLSIQKKEIVLVLAAGGLFLLALLLHQGSNLQQSPTQNNENAASNDIVTKDYVLQNDPLLRQGAYSGFVNPSCEMRENVDFILTPALLVQECMSEGSILTYPEE